MTTSAVSVHQGTKWRQRFNSDYGRWSVRQSKREWNARRRRNLWPLRSNSGRHCRHGFLLCI